MKRIRLPELDRWQSGLMIYAALSALKMVLDYFNGAPIVVPVALPSL